MKFKKRIIILVILVVIIVISLIFIDPGNFIKKVPLTDGTYKVDKSELIDDNEVIINYFKIINLNDINVNGKNYDLSSSAALAHQVFVISTEDGNELYINR